MEVLTDSENNGFEMRAWSCPICRPGRTETRILGYRGGKHHRYGLGVTTRIVQCKGCSLLYSDPFPIPRDPQKLYGDPDRYFAHDDEDAKIEKKSVFLEQVRERLAPAPERGSEVRILDVGCGRGLLLEAARRAGMEAVGLEFSEAMIEHARKKYGIRIERQSIEDYARTTELTFDCVVLEAVLEHVYDPDSMVESVKRVIRPGGVLYIDVPNEPHLLTILGNAWNRLRGNPAVFNLMPTWAPYHIYGFNPRALGQLLAKHGFDLLSVSISSGGSLSARPQLRDRVKAWVGNRLRWVANLTGTASNMTVWARKV